MFTGFIFVNVRNTFLFKYFLLGIGIISIVTMELSCGVRKQISQNEGIVYIKLRNDVGTYLKKSEDSDKQDINIFLNSMKKEYASYLPNIEILDSIRYLDRPFFVEVYGGNWCSDTREGIPRLCKVLDDLKFPDKNFQYFRINQKMKLIDFPINKKLEKAPTVIIHDGKKELGRIIEFPKYRTWEKDILNILLSKY